MHCQWVLSIFVCLRKSLHLEFWKIFLVCKRKSSWQILFSPFGTFGRISSIILSYLEYGVRAFCIFILSVIRVPPCALRGFCSAWFSMGWLWRHLFSFVIVLLKQMHVGERSIHSVHQIWRKILPLFNFLSVFRPLPESPNYASGQSCGSLDTRWPFFMYFKSFPLSFWITLALFPCPLPS